MTEVKRGDEVYVRDYRDGSATYGKVIIARYVCHLFELSRIHRVALDGEIWSVGRDRTLMFVAVPR